MLQLLAQVPVGRVGVSVGALLVVLPVNFVVFEDAVLPRTTPGTKLDAATEGAVVAFESDGCAPDGSFGWSVLVQGMASEIVDPAILARARRTWLDSWALDSSAKHLVRIELSVVSGRKVRSPTTSLGTSRSTAIASGWGRGGRSWTRAGANSRAT